MIAVSCKFVSSKLGKVILFVLTVLTAYCLLLTAAFAQVATKSASLKPSPSPSPSSKGALFDKLEGLKKEAASIAANIKKEIGNKIQNKAYIGTVQSKINDKLIIQTGSGPKTVLIDEFTNFRIGNKKAALKDFDEQDIVASLGDVDDRGNQHGKKIIMIDKSITSNTEIVWGHLYSFADTNATITTTDSKKLNVTLGKGTIYQIRAQEASSSTMRFAKNLIIVGSKNRTGVFKASFIYIIPTPTAASFSAKATSSP